MSTMKWTISRDYKLDDVLSALVGEREAYALEDAENARYRFVRADAWSPEHHSLGAYRPTEPLKAMFFQPREFLGSLSSESPQNSVVRERIVFGVKNCDLSALAIHDHVFLNDGCKDPFYAEAREKTILVSSDCTGFLDVCFCPAVGEQPYPLKGFDINISPTPLGPVLESGSERGQALLQSVEKYLKPAGPELLAAVAKQRGEKYRELSDHTTAHGLKPDVDLRTAIEGTFNSDLWDGFAADCVECGACNFICCTCHCFLLVDGVDAHGEPARVKQWDACLFKDFARTGGGGNPRPRRAERLRNRFDKKFSFFPEILGRYACDGCGRCTEACIGKIDIRDVLRTAVNEFDALHAHPGDG